jgi:hypothetical protein
MESAKLFVPLGTSDQLNAGEMFLPPAAAVHLLVRYASAGFNVGTGQ